MIRNYAVNSVGSTFEYPDLYHKVDGGIKLFKHISVINIIPVTIVSILLLHMVIICFLTIEKESLC